LLDTLLNNKLKIIKDSKSLKLKKDARYSICSCGISNRLPFCDGRHKELNQKEGTSYKSIKIIPSKDVRINIFSTNWIDNIK